MLIEDFLIELKRPLGTINRLTQTIDEELCSNFKTKTQEEEIALHERILELNLANRLTISHIIELCQDYDKQVAVRSKE